MLRAMLLAGSACVFAAGSAAAQSPVHVGLSVGATISTLSGDFFGSEPGYRTAPFLGAVVVYEPAGALGFQTGLLYVQKGATGGEVDGVEAEGTLMLDYAEVPLLARFHVDLGALLRSVFLLGGSVAFRTGCAVEIAFEGTTFEADCDDNIDDVELKSIDIGLTGGLGLDIPVGRQFILTPSVLYTRGLVNVVDDGDVASAKNSSFMVGIAGRLRL